MKWGVGQIEYLTTLPCSKECGIAIGGSLNNLVFDGIEVYCVLTRSGIRTDDDALLLHAHIGRSYRAGRHGAQRVGSINQMVEGLLHGVARRVVGVINEMRHIVALQFQDELQVVTQVVTAQAKGFGQVALVVTAGYASYEPHFGLIVEPHAVQRLRQGEGVFALFHAQNTVALEGMSLLDNLQGIRLPHGERQLEVTVNAGFQRCSVAADRVAVQEEHRARHRDRTALIERTTAQTSG